MKTYIQRYGIEMVKKHLCHYSCSRYFKIYEDYANSGTVVFNDTLFKSDINLPNFPIVTKEQNGWNLPKAPTVKEFEVIYNYLTN